MKKFNALRKKRYSGWQKGFLHLLPYIQRLLSYEFRLLRPQEREEAIQNATVICLVAYARLQAQRRADAANAWSLARYAALQHKSGRVAGGHLNVNDAMSPYAAIRRGIKFLHLHGQDLQNCCWIDAIVEDKRAPIPDVVATKMDFRAWLTTLATRTRKIARDLAKGCCTAETAKRYGVSPGRISQIRRELEHSWRSFQGEPTVN